MRIFDSNHRTQYIDDETLARLLPGEHLTKQPIIIDARYPYEFRGGHIKGAINLYTPQMLIEYLYGMDKENGGGGGVIIFHCEFSSERAPALLRCLRRVDRSRNCYPKLDFPELYLLKDGYKVKFKGASRLLTLFGIELLRKSTLRDDWYLFADVGRQTLEWFKTLPKKMQNCPKRQNLKTSLIKCFQINLLIVRLDWRLFYLILTWHSNLTTL